MTFLTVPFFTSNINKQKRTRKSNTTMPRVSCFVGYQMGVEHFLALYGITEECALERARELNLTPKYDYDNYWLENYVMHLIIQSGSKIVMEKTDKGLIIFGIPLHHEISVCPFKGSVPLSRLIGEAQAAKDLFIHELRKIGDVDLSSVQLWDVEDPHPVESYPEPRLYEWTG